MSATFSARGTAILLKKFLEKNAPKMLQRFVPLCAVGSANCVSWKALVIFCFFSASYKVQMFAYTSGQSPTDEVLRDY